MGNFNYQAVADTVASNRANDQNAAALGLFLNSAIAAYKKHMEDRKADELQAEVTAPQATPVLDAQGNPVIADTGAATHAQERQNNSRLGFGYDTTPDVPDRGGLAGLKLRQSMMDDKLHRALLQAKIAKALTPAAAAKPGAAGPDGLTPAQRIRFDMQRQREARLTDQYDTPKPPKAATDSYSRLNQDFKAVSGHDFSELAREDPNRQHLDDSGFWVGDYKPGEKAGVPTPEWKVPAATYQKFLTRREAIDAGTPTVLNQAAIDAAKAFAGRAGAAIIPSAAKVRVKSPDGKTGVIPAAQLDEALAAGYQQL